MPTLMSYEQNSKEDSFFFFFFFEDVQQGLKRLNLP